MNPRKYFRQLWRAFSHPNVFIFIVIGTGVIFLTFLTDNNAVEIAISGFASVFIGIGVNNLSTFERSAKDAKRLKAHLDHSKQMLELTKSKINGLQKETCDHSGEKLKAELVEIQKLVCLHISFIDQINLSQS